MSLARLKGRAMVQAGNINPAGAKRVAVAEKDCGGYERASYGPLSQ